MKYLENQAVVNLMTWEMNPNKRNINNKVTLVSLNDIDVIFITPTEESTFCHEILKVLHKRAAALKHHKYYTLKTQR